MIVYKTSSFAQTLFSFFYRIAYISVAIFALMHFSDNPLVTVMVTFICLLFFLLTGKDEIIVFSNSIEYKSNSITKYLIKKKAFNIIDIKEFSVRGNFSAGDELYNSKVKADKSLNELVFHLKNDDVVVIKTSIYIDKLKIVEIKINELLDREM